MGKKYKHLEAADRLTMESMLSTGESHQTIADVIGFSCSAIGRERRRNTVAPGPYRAAVAQKLSEQRCADGQAKGRKLPPDGSGQLWPHVIDGLRRRWSPEQIAGRLKRMYEADPSELNASLQVSHETIYCAIFAMPRGELRKELCALLRQQHKKRMPRSRGKGRFTGVQNMTPLSQRPAEVAARIVPGHWEGDLIKGANNRSAVGTLVERTSLYTLLAKMPDASAQSTLEAFTRRLSTVPPELRKTLTYDQGTEMAAHPLLAKQLRIDVFFCDPHSPWQRGINENTNGLLRDYLPKGTDLNQVSYQELQYIEQSLNNRPRKTLNFQTPAEVMAQLKINHTQQVALRT